MIDTTNNDTPTAAPVGSPAGKPGDTHVPETRRLSVPKVTTTISPEMATRIELWPIDRLVPYDKNARTHSPEQIRKLVASITAYGFTNPILVDNDAGIIAGHARLAAARELHLPEVPVIVLSHLSPAQKRAYILADNRLALDAGWDEDLLREELKALDDQGYDLDLVGFDADELKALLAEEPRYGEEDESPPLETVAISRPGDLWILGSHRILCGDALDPSHLAEVLGGEPAAMTFSDPPYGVDYRPTTKPGATAHRPIANDDLHDAFEPFLFQACKNLLAVTLGGVYLCMSSSQLHVLHKAFLAAGGHWSTFLIWAKDRFTLGRSDYQRQYEPILYGWKQGASRYWCGARNQGDVWCFDKPRLNDLHPTMKPVELIERAVTNSSRDGDIVLDVFAGSGSTLIACEKTKRRACLIEIDPLYVDVTVRRWQRYTGGRARLADGRTFEDVAAERTTVREVSQ
jgi:DNA modification methylase